MSFNRENVTWQSRDGTWSIGFWQCFYTGGEDGDPEWDVEYGDTFEWVVTGHASPQAAYDAWDGANPGGTMRVPYAGNEAQCDGYDKLAQAWKERR